MRVHRERLGRDKKCELPKMCADGVTIRGEPEIDTYSRLFPASDHAWERCAPATLLWRTVAARSRRRSKFPTPSHCLHSSGDLEARGNADTLSRSDDGRIPLHMGRGIQSSGCCVVITRIWGMLDAVASDVVKQEDRGRMATARTRCKNCKSGP